MDQKEINKAEWANPENWSVGFSFSKRDSRAWLPKSVPLMGWTLHPGKRAGAYWMSGSLVGPPLLMILLMSFAIGKQETASNEAVLPIAAGAAHADAHVMFQKRC